MGEGEEGGGRGRRRGGPIECSIYFVQDLGASVSGRGARAKSVTRACVLSRARVKSVTRACVLSRARLTNQQIKYASLTKLVRSRWLDIGQVLFLRFYGPRGSRGP